MAVALQALDGLVAAMQARFDQLSEQPASARDAQTHRDTRAAFLGHAGGWTRGVAQAWQAALSPATAEPPVTTRRGALELMGKEAVETRILWSRLSLGLLDLVSWEFNDLRLRIRHLQALTELPARDLLRPEVLSQVLVEQWLASGLTAEAWALVQDLPPQHLAPGLVLAYHEANAFLVDQGVMPEIDLRPLVRVTGGVTPGARPAAAPAASLRAPLTRSGGMATEPATLSSGMMMARERAESVLSELMQVLGSNTTGFDATQRQPPSPALARALAEPAALPLLGSAPPDDDYTPAHVAQVAQQLQVRSQQLKAVAGTPTEKATIEVVALMFQSILTEDRIPAVIRVWFARLQIPVLRVAVSEADFLKTATHPARLLIDRMGACVMGFDASAINGHALETEISRIVQVIEQYPETGRRGFQLVLGEFEKFLTKHLVAQAPAQRVVSVARQVEQRETMTVQYTIELRNLLRDMPVRDTIRDFLFKVWAEVMALASVKYGAQHADTLALKRTATDLVWAASAKPSRHERAQVIAGMPDLLAQLRRGMALLNLAEDRQQAHIDAISATLAEAFNARTDAVGQGQLQALAKRLANLEDCLGDDELDGLPLDAESIELMVGIDASTLEVLADDAVPADEPALAAVGRLALGSWHQLVLGPRSRQVQFVWRSERGQLFLFASADGRMSLVQRRRLAVCVATGQLLPEENDALTVRATREAMQQIEADPARLLG